MRKRDLSTTHYEINLNDWNEDEEEGFDLMGKINRWMDFSTVLHEKNYKGKNSLNNKLVYGVHKK